MDQLNQIGLDLEALKAVVTGLVSVIQEDPESLTKARAAALANVRGWGDSKTQDLIHKQVTAMLAPKL
ncbi:hypothetical protein [Pseudomonas sp. CCOS 191]|uniref:hypothetical protein n=1 Tax=Pseudomonas sp. CCOS 191 TaxID=1649877 RepID=UPI0006244079|nr:hypothetical protein [Pseudomonas sp. CCOS 191]CRI56409.1 hypothetical protein CCOS191_1873 [Pseudomonas sp. CCOS 191]